MTIRSSTMYSQLTDGGVVTSAIGVAVDDDSLDEEALVVVVVVVISAAFVVTAEVPLVMDGWVDKSTEVNVAADASVTKDR